MVAGRGGRPWEAVPVRVGPRYRPRRGDRSGHDGSRVARPGCPSAGGRLGTGLGYSPRRHSCVEVVVNLRGMVEEAAPADVEAPTHPCGGDVTGRGESYTPVRVASGYDSGPESSRRSGLSLLAASGSCSAV